MDRRDGLRRAFSLIELVIVVMIIGIIAAIAIPRMSRGSAGASDAALSAQLETMRKALDLYQAEHQGAYPTDNTTFEAQLTQYTDANGVTSPTSSSVYLYGPYLRSLPPLPVGDQKGSTAVGSTPAGQVPQTVVNGYGWLYDGAGNLYPNTGALTDASGKLYTSY